MSQLGNSFNPSAIASSIDVVIGMYESSWGVSLRAFYIALFPVTLLEGIVVYFINMQEKDSNLSDIDLKRMLQRESLLIGAAAILGLMVGMALFSFIRKALISNYGGNYKRQGPGYNIDQYYREGPNLNKTQIIVLSVSSAMAIFLICFMGSRFYLPHTIPSHWMALSFSLIPAVFVFGLNQEAFSTSQFSRIRLTKILFTFVMAVLASCLHPFHLLSMMKIDHDHVIATMIFWVQLVIIGLEFNEEINVKRIESAQLRSYSDNKTK